MDFEQEKALEEIRHNNQCHRQDNQATIDSGIKAMNALFLLNGASATALLAQKENTELRYAAIVFAFAALWAIASMGWLYVFNLTNSQTWITPEPKTDDIGWIPSFSSQKKLSRNQLNRSRVKLFWFSCVPGVLFLAGLFVAGMVI